MKILVVSPTGTLDNGAEISTLQLMGHLVTLGYQVYNAHPFAEDSVHHRYRDKLLSLGIQSISLSTYQWWWPEALEQFQFDQELATIYYHRHIRELRDCIQQENIELVISNTANVFVGSIAAACEGVRHFWLIHEFPVEEFSYYKEKIHFMSQQSERVFAVTGHLTATLKDLFPEAEQVTSFVPYSPIQPIEMEKGNERRLVSIGRITDNKNQLELLKAYVHRGETDIPLIFIGAWDEEYKSICDDYISKHGLKQVQFLGFCEQPWEHVKKGDICILTSKSEAFPLVFVEGILHGVPMITSNNLGYTSVKEYFGQGKMYELGNIQSLSLAITEALEQFDDLQKMSESHATTSYQKYSLENCYREIVEAIQAPSTLQKYSSLNAVSSLFSLRISQRAQNFLQKENITIYLSDEDGNFSEKNSLIFPLTSTGKIIFSTKEACFVRVDLSENPNVFSRVQLLSEQDDGELQPSFSNGFPYEEGYAFVDFDPQLIYPVSKYDTLTLIYQKSDDSVSSYQLIREKQEQYQYELATLRTDLNEIREQYAQVSNAYHTVIGSRRWIIPTKIIEFFRRKK